MFVTNLADTDIAYLEALYRGRGRAERQICDTKATALANLPSYEVLAVIVANLDCDRRMTTLEARGRAPIRPPRAVRHARLEPAARRQMVMLWVLNPFEGENSLLDIASGPGCRSPR